MMKNELTLEKQRARESMIYSGLRCSQREKWKAEAEGRYYLVQHYRQRIVFWMKMYDELMQEAARKN